MAGPIDIEHGAQRKAVPLRGQVAIVTGGGRGVGRAIAATLAEAGASVAVAARSAAEVMAVAEAIERGGGRALAVQTDVTDVTDVTSLIEETERQLGSPTLLVNNAGTWGHVGPVENADPNEWWGDVEVTLLGTFLCSRAVLPGMLERGLGRIVNVASNAAIAPRPFASAYASTKAAVLRFTDSLAGELEGRGVGVFAVTPGYVRTELVDRVISSAQGQKYLPELAARIDQLEPERAGLLVADIASGRLDPLAGRFIHVLDDVDDLLRRADEIIEQDLYTLRLRI